MKFAQRKPAFAPFLLRPDAGSKGGRQFPPQVPPTYLTVMSLSQTIIALVKQHGPCTVDALMPHLRGYKREQAIQALQNAKTRGHLKCEAQSRKGQDKSAGSRPAIYRMSDESLPPARKRQPTGRRKHIRRPMVASVFELGAQS